MRFVYSTGGREKYFRKPDVRDCCVRAVCNATGMDYMEAYSGINELAKSERKSSRARSSARNGVRPATIKKYIEEVLGWVWVPCMGIGTGCKVHVRDGELPERGNYILNLSGHLSCVRDGALYDTYDCSREGSRCVYGYWREPTEEEALTRRITAEARRAAAEKAASERAAEKAEREKARKHDAKITRQYAVRINKLKAQIRKLERERDSKLIAKSK